MLKVCNIQGQDHRPQGGAGDSSTMTVDHSIHDSAIRGGYEGSSFAVEAIVVFCCALAMYNAVELTGLILFTFSRFRGLYFWSLPVTSLSIILYALGFILKLLVFTEGK